MAKSNQLHYDRIVLIIGTLLFRIGQAVGPSVADAVSDASQSLKGAFLLSSFVAILGAMGAWMLKPQEVMSEDRISAEQSSAAVRNACWRGIPDSVT